ncbi:unnamed protein product [Cuscuta epithymum]|nr:unnamed protein product [Cuscuta epithymum]CAH9085790.1 unnamed protein product [Cuscuta epithymum]CAH9107326.1 unnamed protein product [Cuscuta epithymum]CAH9123930.1 unnamed protein product [Cuscuta epithymum]CAH9138294.1 unnamed protein product [Cuscuta epithymum]
MTEADARANPDSVAG